MNVLSLFNGMSVCAMALEDAGIKTDNIYISEIDKYANKASEVLFSNQIQLGSVCDWRDWDIDWSSIDLVTGGFPCQAWSMAGKQLGDKDERGMLFWTMLDIMKQVRHYNPNADFLIENVKMKKEFEGYITYHTEKALGDVHKILIDSALVSAQTRNRYYWTSFGVDQPKDEGIILSDILEDGSNRVGRMVGRKINPETGKRDDYNAYLKTEQRIEPRLDDKSGCLTTVQKDNIVIRKKSKTVRASGRGSFDRHEWDSISNCHYRKLTVRECLRLQTIPERHINTLLDSGISNTQLYRMTGNGWTMKVISHVFKCMKKAP